MNRHSSVAWLLAKSVLNKALLIISLMLLLQGGVLLAPVLGAAQSFYTIIDSSAVVVIFCVAYAALTVVLCSGYTLNTHRCCTLRRLRISEREVIGWTALMNGVCYLLLWFAQIFILMLFGCLYVNSATAGTVNQQTLVIALYKSSFMYRIFPLFSVLGWIRNLVVVICSALCTAITSFQSRQRKFQFYPFTVYFAALCTFFLIWNCFLEVGASDGNVLIITHGAVISAIALTWLGKYEVAYE